MPAFKETSFEVYPPAQDGLHTETATEGPSMAPALTALPMHTESVQRKMAVAGTAQLKKAVLSFRDLKYSLKAKKKQQGREILHGLNGVFGHESHGSLTAIMGQSGSGKTTLLNVLGRRAEGVQTGEMFFNGRPISRETVRRFMGYVHQEDHHFAELTVRETLQFVAELAMWSSTPEARKERVTTVITLLGLAHAADRNVGHASGVAGLKRGISGGERKRLSVASALITDPSLLFLDEYTSGLDSESANNTTDLLVDLAAQGRTIICTIHQPSTEIFFKFDRLCLLSQGRIVYFGPTADVMSHFSSIGHPCPAYYNPAEHIMSVIHTTVVKDDSEKFEAHYKASPLGIEMQQRVEAIHSGPEGLGGSKKVKERDPSLAETQQHKASLLTQLYWLSWRTWKLQSRNKMVTRIKVIVTIVMAVFLGAIYWNLPANQAGINDRVFLLLFSTTLMGVRTTLETVRFFSAEKIIYLRQHESNLYSATPYLLCRDVISLPFHVIFPLIYTAIVLPMSTLRFDHEHFVIFWLAISLLTINAHSIGIFIACAIVNEEVLTVAAPLVVLPVILFSGITSINIPPALSWIEQIVYLRYGVSILMQNEFAGRTYTTSCNENGVCNQIEGDQILDSFDMKQLTIGENFAVMAGFAVIFKILAVFMLIRVANAKKS